MRKYATWDIETWKITPQECDVREHRPLGISCAALLLSDRPEHPIVWRAADREKMTVAQVRGMMTDLGNLMEDYTIVTWAGLGFDFDIAGEEAQWLDSAGQMAMSHIDMMFHFFCVQGYLCSLENACIGMGVEGKMKSVGGANAPQMWQDGECDKVVEYVIQDVRAAMNVALAVDQCKGMFKWRTKKGALKAVNLGAWKTANEAMRLPHPDQSWMDKPMSREEFYRWTQQ